MKSPLYSHGKLLLTGEYVVLDGAQALAIPTKKGQRLEVSTNDQDKIRWQSLLHDGSIWMDLELPLPLPKKETTKDSLHQRLLQILHAVQQGNPNCFGRGINFKSTLEFDRDWGLGSSSTLLDNMAQWAQIDPYELLKKTFGGSGYDIACARAKGPITYKNTSTLPEVSPVDFNPSFKDQLFFVHLNRKQNSRDSITHYRNTSKANLGQAIEAISHITTTLLIAENITEFEGLLEQHESIISELIKTPTIKMQYFADYSRTIKSLGGWGGDFILATGGKKEQEYFRKKGFTTVMPYKDMLL